MMSSRVLSLTAVSVLVAASLIGLLLAYKGTVCFIYEYNQGAIFLFLLLPIVFSLGVVWLISEAISWLISGTISRPITTSSWLISDMISRPITTRLLSILLAFGVHFSIGAVGWATFSDVPAGQNPPDRAWVWVPLWIIGVLFKVGNLSLCE